MEENIRKYSIQVRKIINTKTLFVTYKNIAEILNKVEMIDENLYKTGLCGIRYYYMKNCYAFKSELINGLQEEINYKLKQKLFHLFINGVLVDCVINPLNKEFHFKINAK